jgi:uracil-DNA glycosylase
MDRREAILRELNLYPQWVRRGQTVPLEAGQQLPFVPTAEAIIPKDSEVTAPLELAVPLESTVIEQQSRPSTQVEKLDWPELKQQVRDCTACSLRAGCTQTVFGVGDEKADWLFVGEGPGADEDALGEPFVGQAGKLLDNMLAAIKLKRGKNVYIANIVKCRPPGNRNPEANEIAQCLPYLERQIALIQPRLIVALGKVAANALLGRDATIASLRGMLHDYHGIPLIVTYHPAYLLRSPSEKAKAWQDLCFAVRSLHGEA